MTANQIMDLLISLNESQGQTFVLVTHGREIAERCHRIVHMRDGEIESEEQLVG